MEALFVNSWPLYCAMLDTEPDSSCNLYHRQGRHMHIRMTSYYYIFFVDMFATRRRKP